MSPAPSRSRGLSGRDIRASRSSAISRTGTRPRCSLCPFWRRAGCRRRRGCGTTRGSRPTTSMPRLPRSRTEIEGSDGAGPPSAHRLRATQLAQSSAQCRNVVPASEGSGRQLTFASIDPHATAETKLREASVLFFARALSTARRHIVLQEEHWVREGWVTTLAARPLPAAVVWRRLVAAAPSNRLHRTRRPRLQARRIPLRPSQATASTWIGARRLWPRC